MKPGRVWVEIDDGKIIQGLVKSLTPETDYDTGTTTITISAVLFNKDLVPLNKIPPTVSQVFLQDSKMPDPVEKRYHLEGNLTSINIEESKKLEPVQRESKKPW